MIYSPPKSSKFSGKRAVVKEIDWSYDPTAEIEFLDNPGPRLETLPN